MEPPFFLLLVTVAAVVAVILAVSGRSRFHELDARIRSLEAELRALSGAFTRLRREIHPPAPAGEGEPRQTPVPRPPIEGRPGPAPPPVAPEAPPVQAAAMPSPPLAPPPVSVVVPGVIPTPPKAPPPSPPPAPPRTTIPPVPPAPPAGFDWEGLVGVKLFSWIAGIFLAIGAVFFLRYSIERGWLSAPVRMAMGLLVGTALLVVCEWKAARRYAITANALDGAGIAILFSTFFASHALWRLIAIAPAFVSMALVTAVAVALSIRRDSVFIALLGLIGGFATPALLSTGEDRPFGLFGYLLLLNAGLAWVAYRKRWPLLSVLSVVFTTFYQWAWVAKFLTEAKLGLAAGIFLVFPILSVVALWAAPGRTGGAPGPLFGRTAAASAGMPLLFAVFMAAVPAYGSRWVLLFGFLLFVSVGLAALAAVRGPEELHVLGAAATLLVFGVWLVQSGARADLRGILGFLSAFVLLYLGADSVAARLKRPYREAGRSAIFAAPLLLFVVTALILADPATGAPGLVFTTLFILAAAVSISAASRQRPELHIVAAPLVVAAEIAWLFGRLVPSNLLPGLLIFAVFGVFYLAVPLAGHGLKATAFFALSAHLLLLFIAARPSLSNPPAPLLGVLGVLTIAGTVVSLPLRETNLATAVLAASQIVLIVFEASAGKSPWPEVVMWAALAVAVWGVGLWAISRRQELALPAAVGLFLAQAVGVAASLTSGSPGVSLHVSFHLTLLVLLLAIAWITGTHVLAVLAAATSSIAAFTFYAARPGAGDYREDLLLAGGLFLPFLLYPLLLGRRAGKVREPYLAAVLYSVAFFFLARTSLLAGGFKDVIGMLPIGEALALAVLLVRLLRLGVPPAEDVTRIALVAAAILAFVTVAIPLQLEKEWITIGWAVLAAALAWLYGRVPHRGLLLAAGALFGAVFARLALNPAVLTYHPRSATAVWNWYLYTYLVPAVAFFVGAALLARSARSDDLGLMRALTGLLPAGGAVLLFLLLNIEIADFFSRGPSLTFNVFSATLAEGLSYTLGWAVFAIALLLAGILLRRRPPRLAAVVLLLATVLKCFLLDLSRLGGLYRVASFVGLAASLAAVAVLLQRFVLPGRREPA